MDRAAKCFGFGTAISVGIGTPGQQPRHRAGVLQEHPEHKSMTPIKQIQPELTFDAASREKPREKPREIVTETSEEFFRLCDMADNGDLRIEAIEQGRTNGQWICELFWLR